MDTLLALEAGRAPGFKFREGRPEAVWPAFDAGAVIVSEPFAFPQEGRS